jgi:hypothetical protein
MDIETIATAIVAALAPFTPFLVEIGKIGGEKLVEIINKNGGEAAWKLAQKLWGKIQSSMNDEADVQGTALMVSAKPEDDTRQTMLAVALAIKLRTDPKLAEEFSDLLGGQRGVQQVIASRKSVVKDVMQQMNGVGEQTVKADNSRVQGVRQVRK